MNIESLKNEENELRHKIKTLSDNQRRKYFELESKRIKDPDTYAALNFFFITGLHHFYLNKPIKGSINLFLFMFGLFNLSTFGLILIGLVIIIELPQLFMSQKIVYAYNNKVMRYTLDEIKSF